MSRPPLLIACDFDGTVTQNDVTNFLLATLADSRWRQIEAAWEAGLISSRECMVQQIPLIRGGWGAIEAQLAQVELDPTFPAFAFWCKEQRVPLWIVSDGLDRVISTVFARAHVTVDRVWANHLEESSLGELSISFPHSSVDGACCAGLCKCQVIGHGAAEALRVVIGDGRSDWCWAAHADVVFAKSQLLTHCRAQGVPCAKFSDFNEIQQALTLMWDRPEYVVRSNARGGDV